MSTEPSVAAGIRGRFSKAAQCTVYAIDRDAEALAAGAALAAAFPGRLTLIEGLFSSMDSFLPRHGVQEVDGIVLDVGVSSMQIDDPARGFSFRRTGRSTCAWAEAAKRRPMWSTASEEANSSGSSLSSARNGVPMPSRAPSPGRGREQPFTRTGELARLVESVLGRRPQDPIHPATRTFQALAHPRQSRARGTGAGARRGGETCSSLAGGSPFVTFHSLEDRIVKSFLIERSGNEARPSRHRPAATALHQLSCSWGRSRRTQRRGSGSESPRRDPPSSGQRSDRWRPRRPLEPGSPAPCLDRRTLTMMLRLLNAILVLGLLVASYFIYDLEHSTRSGEREIERLRGPDQGRAGKLSSC